jgi:hypothetical protein
MKLQDGAGRAIDTDQYMVWVVSQAIRNALELFHGGGAYDPENPDSGEGFITDKQMRALNIVIRRTVYDAFDALALLENPTRNKREGVDYCLFQIRTVNDYMEPPGSPELEEAYNEIQHVVRPDNP